MDGVPFQDKPDVGVCSIADIDDYLFNIEADPKVEIKPFINFRPKFGMKHGYYQRHKKRKRPPKMV